MHVCMLSLFSHVLLFATPWTVACQTPLSVGFSRQEYWSGWPCPPRGDLPNPGIEHRPPALGPWSLSPLTTKEVPCGIHFKDVFIWR